jgi:hypothetical protein
LGHQVEYLLDIAPAEARRRLSPLEGFWIEPESPGGQPYGELRLWDALALHADLSPSACRLAVPQIKYSWLIAGHPAPLADIERLERLLVELLPGVPIIRVDEFVRLKWEADIGSAWDDLPTPAGSLCEWLFSSNEDSAYFRFLPEPTGL